MIADTGFDKKSAEVVGLSGFFYLTLIYFFSKVHKEMYNCNDKLLINKYY